MKLVASTLLIGLSLGSVTARAQATDEQPEASPQGISVDPSPERPMAERTPPLDPSRATTARGELTRVSALPEAELMLDVRLESNDERARFEIFSEKTGASLLTCSKPCAFRIWPGRYRVVTDASASFVGGTNQFVVERSATLRLNEPSRYRPILGGIVGVIGMLGVIVGGTVFGLNACDSDCGSGALRRSQIGFALLGAGLVITPAGWVLFAQSRAPELMVEQSQSRRE